MSVTKIGPLFPNLPRNLAVQLAPRSVLLELLLMLTLSQSSRAPSLSSDPLPILKSMPRNFGKFFLWIICCPMAVDRGSANCCKQWYLIGDKSHLFIYRWHEILQGHLFGTHNLGHIKCSKDNYSRQFIGFILNMYHLKMFHCFERYSVKRLFINVLFWNYVLPENFPPI